jgi:3-methyladenine DNA glycosylase AlkD
MLRWVERDQGASTDQFGRLLETLDARAAEKSKAFWQKHLKGNATFGRLFARGHIADRNVCDGFSVKVLGKMIMHAEEPLDLATAISAWRFTEPLWQRRAACMALVNYAKHGDARIPGLTSLILENAAARVRDPRRFAQTGVGWVLRELSLAEPKAGMAFAERIGFRFVENRRFGKDDCPVYRLARGAWPLRSSKESHSDAPD